MIDPPRVHPTRRKTATTLRRNQIRRPPHRLQHRDQLACFPSVTSRPSVVIPGGSVPFSRNHRTAPTVRPRGPSPVIHA